MSNVTYCFCLYETNKMVLIMSPYIETLYDILLYISIHINMIHFFLFTPFYISNVEYY